MRLRRSIVVFTGLALPLVGCGDDIPDRGEFIEQMSLTARSGFVKSADSAGIDKERAGEIFDEWVGCIYDKVSSDQARLEELMATKGDAALNAAVAAVGKPCEKDRDDALTQAMADASGAGSPTTTAAG